MIGVVEYVQLVVSAKSGVQDACLEFVEFVLELWVQGCILDCISTKCFLPSFKNIS